MGFSENDLIRNAVVRLLELEYETLIMINVNTGEGRYAGQNGEGEQYFMSASFDYRDTMEEYINHSQASSKEIEMNHITELNYVMANLEMDEAFEVLYTVQLEDDVTKNKRLKFFYVDDDREWICCVRMDVTSVAASERSELEETKKALQDARQTNDKITEFITRVIHDVRTPMNGLLGLIKLTSEMPCLTEEAKNNMQAMDDACHYMQGLINDTFDIGKIESNRVILNPEVVNAKSFMEHMKAYITPAAKEKNLELKLIPINTDLNYVRADRMRLQQILMNLLTNAVKFTNPGGTIECMIERLKCENGYYHEKITIRDTGIGMSPEFLEKVFEPFSQENADTSANFAGSGLGLFLVKNLVELMGGQIEIKSVLGVGTEAIVYLPLEMAQECDIEKAKEQPESIDNVDLTGKNILLCEDHPLNTKITVKLLEKVGCMVETAENGKDGLDLFLEKPSGYYDLILMDIRMPVMDGLTATRNIRTSGKDDAETIPIVAMTANAFDEDVKASKAAGMNEHLAKPVDTVLLYEVLLKFLQ